MAWIRTGLEMPAITGHPAVLLATPPPDYGTILTRTGSLDSSFISLIEKAVDQLGKFGSTQGLYSEIAIECLRSTKRD